MVQTIKNNTCTSLYSNPIEMVFTEETTNHWLVGCTAHVIRDNIQITKRNKAPKHSHFRQMFDIERDNTYRTASIFFSPTIAKERTILSVWDVMIFMADFSTYCAHANPIIHLTGVAVVPVLVHKLFLSHCKCTELVAKRIFILRGRDRIITILEESTPKYMNRVTYDDLEERTPFMTFIWQ